MLSLELADQDSMPRMLQRNHISLNYAEISDYVTDAVIKSRHLAVCIGNQSDGASPDEDSVPAYEKVKYLLEIAKQDMQSQMEGVFLQLAGKEYVTLCSLESHRGDTVGSTIRAAPSCVHLGLCLEGILPGWELHGQTPETRPGQQTASFVRDISGGHSEWKAAPLSMSGALLLSGDCLALHVSALPRTVPDGAGSTEGLSPKPPRII
ncbi:hypothetical protein P7K49_025075 [Saguinus oedipus]|uniref:Uncharacterized protein n=1 Tax=Saguinus oedipus TaxID=9490 RepID=A0ABQ9UG64_SAGOE|nr:hypothetical protein P7K49_025075 [Saguinus oedipus]